MVKLILNFGVNSSPKTYGEMGTPSQGAPVYTKRHMQALLTI